MAEMDGIVFLKEVRSVHGDIPFILFTGKGREEVVIEAISSGVDFYLQKGGDPKALYADLAHKIGIAIERKRAVRELKDSEAPRQADHRPCAAHDLRKRPGRELYPCKPGRRGK